MTNTTEGPLNYWHTTHALEVEADKWNDRISNLFSKRDACGRNCMDAVTAGDLDRATRHAWQGTAYDREIQAILAGPRYDAHYLKNA